MFGVLLSLQRCFDCCNLSFNVSFPQGTEETPRKFTKKKGKENEVSSESMQSSSEQAHRLLNRIKSKLSQIRCGKIATFLMFFNLSIISKFQVFGSLPKCVHAGWMEGSKPAESEANPGLK